MSEHTSGQPQTFVEQRTVAFFADPGTSNLLLQETIEKLIESLGIRQGLVDITTMAGVSIAQAFMNTGVSFATLEYGQEPHYEWSNPDAVPGMSPELRHLAATTVSSHLEELTNHASGVLYQDVPSLGTVDANIVLIPAVSAQNPKLLDFAPHTLVGVVLAQIEDAGRDAIVIDAPERGLQPLGDGAYQRAVIHVKAGSDKT